MTAARRCLAASLLVVVACEAVPVELDPTFGETSALCAGVVCDGTPRCPDGGNTCLVCACCPCTEGSSICDPTAEFQRWTCQAGCFVDTPCDFASTCIEGRTGASCVDTEIDCGRVPEQELIAVCGVNTELCDRCGCYTCDAADAGLATCRFGEVGSDVLTCTAAGCFSMTSCGAEGCATGVLSGAASCEPVQDCASLGCTSPPICGDPSGADCGPCGCCAADTFIPVRAGETDFCWRATDDHAREARWIFDLASECYQVLPCYPGEACLYDRYDRPVCASTP